MRWCGVCEVVWRQARSLLRVVGNSGEDLSGVGADQTGREEARGKEVQAIGELRLLVGEKLKYQ